MFDGQVARRGAMVTKFGAFYDSTLDRIGDADLVSQTVTVQAALYGPYASVAAINESNSGRSTIPSWSLAAVCATSAVVPVMLIV